MDDAAGLQSASVEELREEVERLRLLNSIGQEFSSSLDFDELLPKIFNSVLDAVGAQGGSIWIAEGDELRCKLALGAASQKLVGTTMPVGTGFVGDVARRQRSTIVTDALHDERFQHRVDRSSTMITTTLMAAPMIAKGITVGAIQVTNKVLGDGIFDERDRQVLEGLASSAAVALRNAQLHSAEKRARDLALLLEISREITSTLDLDRVLQSVVNLSSRALTFDRGAVGMLRNGVCDIQAIAGEEAVDRKKPETVRLAERGVWAATRGETYYLADRGAPKSDTDRAFVEAFGSALGEDGTHSALYLPLKDEQGTLGILMFEAQRADFTTTAQRELAEILANQTSVALRNAELYHEVPLVDALGAIAAKKRALLAMPRRRLQVYASGVVLALAAATLIRWPFRVTGQSPTFRAAGYAEVRAMVPGIVDRVAVREGMWVSRGAPLAQLRDVDLRAARESKIAEATVAERGAAVAASRGNAAEQRMQDAVARALRQEVALLDEQIAATTLRAAVAGVVLTARPEERVGGRLDAGDLFVTVGRVDTLVLDFGVRQRDIERVAVGQAVRVRVSALPQRTFEGRVVHLGEMPTSETGDDDVFFPVRAVIPNPDSTLRPGMAAYAKVLTAPASFATRVVRGPARWLRLSWWRARP